MFKVILFIANSPVATVKPSPGAPDVLIHANLQSDKLFNVNFKYNG